MIKNKKRAVFFCGMLFTVTCAFAAVCFSTSEKEADAVLADEYVESLAKEAADDVSSSIESSVDEKLSAFDVNDSEDESVKAAAEIITKETVFYDEAAVEEIVKKYLSKLNITKLSNEQIESIGESIKEELSAQLKADSSSYMTESDVKKLISGIDYSKYLSNTGLSEKDTEEAGETNEEEIKNIVEAMLAGFTLSESETEKISEDAAEIAAKNVSQAITKVKDEVDSLDSDMALLSSKITKLQKLVSAYSSSAGSTTESVTNVTYTTDTGEIEENIDNLTSEIEAISKSIEALNEVVYITSSASGDADKKSVTEYVTILADAQKSYEEALEELKNIIAAYEDEAAKKLIDSWAYDIYLNTSEADTECDGYAYVWTLTYDATGLYFKEDSEITIKYADDTYAVLVYEQGDGYLKIMVPEEYKDTCPDVLLIESAHCETDGKYLD